MGIRRADITVATNASGGGTATAPLSGEIVEVRYNGTALNDATKADWTITRQNDGGTILALSNVAGPWQRAPRELIHTTTGGTLDTGGLTAALTSQVDRIPVEGGVQVVIAEGKASASDALHVFYCNE